MLKVQAIFLFFANASSKMQTHMPNVLVNVDKYPSLAPLLPIVTPVGTH